MASNTLVGRSWRKILYLRSNFPDNYIDSKFLATLNNNKSPSNASFSAFILDTTCMLQQLTILAIFVAIYKLLVDNIFNFQDVIIFDATLLIAYYVIHLVLADERGDGFLIGTELVLISGICLRVTAPVLQTLTSSFSDDTVYALSISFSILHLIFYDYSFVYGSKQLSSGTLSLNAAMVAAIMLASRIDQIEQVFSFILFAVICFYMYPSTARLLKKRSNIHHIVTIVVHWLIATALLSKIDVIYLIAYESIMIVILFVSPLCMYGMQSRKRLLHGPWDIAAVD